MGAAKKFLAQVAWSALVFSGFAGGVLPLAGQQVANAATIVRNDSSVPSAPPLVANVEDPNATGNSTELPDSPGVVAAKSGDAGTQQGQTQTGAATTSSQSQAPANQAEQPQRPLGTAAAEAPNASGVAASQPSGVAIAPGKQHRARTIVIRIGAIAAAGVALGTVLALTAATPSKPPGAH
jgi:hypothetical protein